MENKVKLCLIITTSIFFIVFIIVSLGSYSEYYNRKKEKVRMIPNALTNEECDIFIDFIDKNAVPSTTTTNTDYFRTSYSAHVGNKNEPPHITKLVEKLDKRFAKLVGVDRKYSEKMQGQRYHPGEYFKVHHDAFDYKSKNDQYELKRGGQRTYTLMVYLNDVEEGGETYFPNIKTKIKPQKGMVIIWHNLDEKDQPDKDMRHEGKPVKKGKKYIITKWFRKNKGMNEV